jgi:dihydrofolate reductase
MAKIVVSEFLTLDGVMQAPGSPTEDTSGGFEHGGWQLAYFDDVFGKAVVDGFAATDGFLLGRRTWETFAAHWPNQPADDPLAGTLNNLPKYVASRTLTPPLSWENSRVIKGDIAEAVRGLRSQPGRDIQVIGSGQLVQTLVANDLVDEYRLMIHPLVLGGGKRLFRETPAPVRLRLVDATPTTTGVLIVTYVPAQRD